TRPPQPPYTPAMNRRDFLRSAAAATALAALPRYAAAGAAAATRGRLLGTGWYGKTALFRLLQVAPVEVVSLCDADSRMLANAAVQVASRQASKKTPRTYSDY